MPSSVKYLKQATSPVGRIRQKARKPPPVYARIRQILEAARLGLSRTVNTTQVVANWLIGREIVEEEQQGEKRAGYGERLLGELSERLQAEFGGGYSVDNLEWFRQFYLAYPRLLVLGNSDVVRRISWDAAISDAPRRKSSKTSSQHIGGSAIAHARRDKSLAAILNTPPPESWRPGQLHPNLSWTHYRTLLRVEKREARCF